jgi:hypothetical protein
VQKHSISVWFFIGVLFLVYGVLILGSGVYGLFVPPLHPVAMSQLHIDLWWGAGMMVVGLAYVARFKPQRAKQSRVS